MAMKLNIITSSVVLAPLEILILKEFPEKKNELPNFNMGSMTLAVLWLVRWIKFIP